MMPNYAYNHRIIDDRIEKYDAYIVVFSKSDCRNEECVSRWEMDTKGGWSVGHRRAGTTARGCRSGVKYRGDWAGQIVPPSSSLYTLFYSVFYNSVP